MSAPKNCLFCFVKLYSLCSYYFDMYILSQVFLLVDNCIFLASMNKVPILLFICGWIFSFVDPMLTHKSRIHVFHISVIYNIITRKHSSGMRIVRYCGLAEGVRYTLVRYTPWIPYPLDTLPPKGCILYPSVSICIWVWVWTTELPFGHTQVIWITSRPYRSHSNYHSANHNQKI